MGYVGLAAEGVKVGCRKERENGGHEASYTLAEFSLGPGRGSNVIVSFQDERTRS